MVAINAKSDKSASCPKIGQLSVLKCFEYLEIATKKIFLFSQPIVKIFLCQVFILLFFGVCHFTACFKVPSSWMYDLGIKRRPCNNSQIALDCTENAIKISIVELPLPTDDIMDLLNLCLTSTYFQYNGKHYKQLHGTAMGSPVSVVVAEIVMQNITDQALTTYTRTVPLWLGYVDDTFTAVNEDGIDEFHENTLTDRMRTYSSPRR